MNEIHNYKKRLENTLKRINLSTEISKINKKLILNFHNYCFSEGIGCAKTERYIYDCFTFAKSFKKRLDILSKEELQKFVAQIEMNDWSPNTKHSFKIMIRKFYKFVEGITERGVYPEKVRWLKSNVKNCQQKLPSELLTEDEIEKMINSTDNFRDKSLVAVLYETGCRIGEIGNLKIKEIEYSGEYGGNDWAIIFDGDLKRISNKIAENVKFKEGRDCDSIKGVLISSKVYGQFIGLLKNSLKDIKINENPLEKEITNPEFCSSLWIKQFSYEEEIIKLYKKNRYGLSSAIFCKNTKKALELAEKINTARVIINSDTLDIHPLIPWGGIKSTSHGGAEYWVNKFSNKKLIEVS